MLLTKVFEGSYLCLYVRDDDTHISPIRETHFVFVLNSKQTNNIRYTFVTNVYKTVRLPPQTNFKFTNDMMCI